MLDHANDTLDALDEAISQGRDDVPLPDEGDDFGGEPAKAAGMIGKQTTKSDSNWWQWFIKSKDSVKDSSAVLNFYYFNLAAATSFSRLSNLSGYLFFTGKRPGDSRPIFNRASESAVICA